MGWNLNVNRVLCCLDGDRADRKKRRIRQALGFSRACRLLKVSVKACFSHPWADGFSEWIFEVDPFTIAGELEQPQNIRWDIVRQMALYMVIIGQIDT